jgi:3-keto-disaccharide hydrolase
VYSARGSVAPASCRLPVIVGDAILGSTFSLTLWLLEYYTMPWLKWLLCAALVVAARGTFAIADDFQPLFDGKSLTGWFGDPDLWKVEKGPDGKGMIVGCTDEKPLTRHNSFLSYGTKDDPKVFKNFVLKLKFRMRNGNSGVQVRSKQFEEYIVRGYQADIAESRFTGILYEEGGRGILADVDQAAVAKIVKPFKADEPDVWNEYVITCDGPHIKQVLNGVTTIDYTEKSEKGAKEGVIALQLHAGFKMKIYFKDIEIKELP